MSRAREQREAQRSRGSRADSVVVDGDDLGVLVVDLWSRDRVSAVVAVAHSVDGEGPVLLASQVRTVVEPGTRVYVVPDALLGALRREVGSRLALEPGAVRIWWPGVSRRSDPADHPAVVPLEGESPDDLLAEFARQLHLSHPDVRREIRRIEEARDEAEAGLEVVKRQLRAACGLAGVGRKLGLRALRGDAEEQASILRVFGPNLAVSRAKAGLSQVELSNRCFIRADQVSLLECGERDPTLLILLVLAQALEVSVADLTAGLPPLTREAGRERMRRVIAKARPSRRSTQHLADASGLPDFYVRDLLFHMREYGEVTRDSTGWQLATPPPKRAGA